MDLSGPTVFFSGLFGPDGVQNHTNEGRGKENEKERARRKKGEDKKGI